MGASASTTPNPKFDRPVKDSEESPWEHFVSNVFEDLVLVDCLECGPLRQQRAARSLGARVLERTAWEHFVSNASEELLPTQCRG